MGVFVVTAPTERLVTLEQLKDHCRIDTADEDATLEVIIGAVTNALDGPGGDSGFAFLPQRLEMRQEAFCSQRGELAYPPLRSGGSVSVKYLDMDGVEQTLSPSAYFIAQADPYEAYFRPATGVTLPAVAWRPDAVRIQYDVGFEVLPPRVAQAALLMAATLFENREAFDPNNAVEPQMTPIAQKLLGGFWRPRIP